MTTVLNPFYCDALQLIRTDTFPKPISVASPPPFNNLALFLVRRLPLNHVPRCSTFGSPEGAKWPLCFLCRHRMDDIQLCKEITRLKTELHRLVSVPGRTKVRRLKQMSFKSGKSSARVVIRCTVPLAVSQGCSNSNPKN